MNKAQSENLMNGYLFCHQFPSEYSRPTHTYFSILTLLCIFLEVFRNHLQRACFFFNWTLLSHASFSLFLWIWGTVISHMVTGEESWLITQTCAHRDQPYIATDSTCQWKILQHMHKGFCHMCHLPAFPFSHILLWWHHLPNFLIRPWKWNVSDSWKSDSVLFQLPLPIL